LARSLAATYGLGKRVLVIAHTDELIEQAASKARQRNPHLTVGIVKAGLNQAHAQIVVSSRQTLQSAKRREQHPQRRSDHRR
jgi:superfamily II DNA or RNA helicase